MTAREQFTNGASTTLGADITAGAGTLTVASYAGFPTTGQYRVRVDSELLIVTGGLGTATWTVTRHAEGTSATSHSAGAAIVQQLTAGGLDSLVSVYDAGILVSSTRLVRMGAGLSAVDDAGTTIVAVALDLGTLDIDSPPTDAQLDAEFGQPGSLGAGYVALADDAGAGTLVYLVASDGAAWWHVAMTKAV
jgi:hypothetical protein